MTPGQAREQLERKRLKVFLTALGFADQAADAKELREAVQEYRWALETQDRIVIGGLEDL